MTLLSRSTPAQIRGPRRTRLAAIAATFGVLVSATGALAHHSFAAFHQDKEQSVTGVVKEWHWTNPHTFMTVTAPFGPTGALADYIIEGGAPSMWRQRGWNRDVVKPGDRVNIKFHPRKDGMPGGNFVDITGADGRSLKAQS